MKGFTFEQLAVILLVILGLVVVVVIAATQLSSAGSKFTEIGSQTSNKQLTINLGVECFNKGGFCKSGSSVTDCSSGSLALGITKSPNSDCGDNKVCCKP